MHVAMVCGLIALGSLSWCAGMLSVGPVVCTHSWPADTCMSFSSTCGYLRAAYSSLLNTPSFPRAQWESGGSRVFSPPFPIIFFFFFISSFCRSEREGERERERERERETERVVKKRERVPMLLGRPSDCAHEVEASSSRRPYDGASSRRSCMLGWERGGVAVHRGCRRPSRVCERRFELHTP